MRSWKQLWILGAAALALAACANDKTSRTGGGEPSATASPSASASASASSSAQAAASPAEAQYAIDVQAVGIEQPPEGTTLEPVSPDSPIYIPPGSKDAQVHLAFNMSKKGDFNLAEGTGELIVGGNSVPFEINQVSVMHKETLSSGQTFYFGGLQVDTDGDPSTFAFGFRFIPETKDLQLRLSNGEGIVVFGGGDAIAKNEQEIEKLEADHRPRN